MANSVFNHFASDGASETATGYPGVVFSPVLFLDRDRERAVAPLSFTVPAGAPYTVSIPVERPDSLTGVTVGGAARTRTESVSPASGYYYLSRTSGRMIFNAADAGGAAVVTYSRLVSALPGQFLNQLQAHLVATETRMNTLLGTGTYASVSLADGTVSVPGLYFGADTDTGLYRSTANTMGIAAGGAVSALFTATQMTLAGQAVWAWDSANSRVRLSYNGSTTNSMWQWGTTACAFIVGGAFQMWFEAGAAYPNTNNAFDLGKSAQRYKKAWLVDGDFSGTLISGSTITRRFAPWATERSAALTAAGTANAFWIPLQLQTGTILTNVEFAWTQTGTTGSTVRVDVFRNTSGGSTAGRGSSIANGSAVYNAASGVTSLSLGTPITITDNDVVSIRVYIDTLVGGTVLYLDQAGLTTTQRRL